jgi:dephospho-CoA kinase
VTARRVGLTGGIGSGKSTVASLWVNLGARLIDTDAIAKELTTAGGAALPAIEREFGPAALGPNGELDRGRMRELAFADPTARRRLEAVLHPMIGALAQQRAMEAIEPFIVFDVPLLTESSLWRRRCNRIVVVDCLEATQVRRVMERSQWSEGQVRAVIAQQTSRARRRAIADAVIYNDGPATIADLTANVQSLWNLWSSPLSGDAH